MNQIQRRFTSGGKVAIERRAEKSAALVGYAAVFYRKTDPGTEYQLWEDMTERIMPGAFDRAIREDDVRGLFNHDASFILGRTVAGTAKLSVDETGLRYEIELPDTQQARDLAALIERGDVTGSSFAFIAERASWVEEDKKMIRQVEAVRLFDVGPVTYPAYEATTTGMRSSDAEAIRRELNAFKSLRQEEADRVNVRADLVRNGLTGAERAA